MKGNVAGNDAVPALPRAGEGHTLPSEAAVLAAVAPTSMCCVHVMENTGENTVPNRQAFLLCRL